MKKIVLLLTVAFILSNCCTVFAENTVDIKSVTLCGEAVTVNFDTSGLAADDSLTVITYKADNNSDAPDETNIKYIDQLTKDAKTDISFKLNEMPSGVYQIKMGGTDVNTNASISISVEEGMKETINYINNKLSVFSKPLGSFDILKEENDKIYILKPTVNYIAAYSTVPSLDGYTIKERGIRMNGIDYTAKVAFNETDTRYGVLFTNVSDEISITAYPYIVYENAEGETITYYGAAYVDKVSYASDEEN